MTMRSEFVCGFDYIAPKGATVLVLGSIPSIRSKALAEYYGHPGNAFWKIIARFADMAYTRETRYADKTKCLGKLNIALWDVVRSCERTGSLDNRINTKSVTLNDFSRLFKECPGIGAVFFNGKAAFNFYDKYLPAEQKKRFPGVVECLPSTSPANARMPFEEKLMRWSIVKNYIA